VGDAATEARNRTDEKLCASCARRLVLDGFEWPAPCVGLHTQQMLALAAE
jgi:hypothetical protein